MAVVKVQILKFWYVHNECNCVIANIIVLATLLFVNVKSMKCIGVEVRVELKVCVESLLFFGKTHK